MTEFVKAEFAKRLRNEIKNQGRTFEEVAESAGIGATCIFRAVNQNDTSMPTSWTLVLLCEELNISSDYLLFGKDGRQLWN